MNQPDQVTLCCDDFRRATQEGTDNEAYGAAIWWLNGWQVGIHETSRIRFCPWCGVKLAGAALLTPKSDEVWADEGGISVRFSMAPHGGVRIEIKPGINSESVLASATLGRWRWDRIVQAMGKPSEESQTGS